MYYAKSKPDVLTVVEHTLDVVEAVKALAQAYSKELSLFTSKDFELVEIAALYHDVGKYSETFQNIIRPSIDKKWRMKNLKNYPHNYLSVCFLPYSELQRKYSKQAAQMIVFAVGFHHEKSLEPNEKEITRFFMDYIVQAIPTIVKEMPLPFSASEKLNRYAIRDLCNREKVINSFDQKAWYQYILIKGLLQRADHAASAKRKGEAVADYVEEAVDSDVGAQTKAFLEKQFKLRPLQTLAYENQHKNIILIAQTGSGKTEAALLWIGQKKGFITLPLRVSLNAMFDRIHRKDIGFASTGLLHSSAIDHLMTQGDESESFVQSVLQTDHTRLLAKKLTLSTIDQLFKFPLLYRGFETELATLAYSKVVIDEIQAYDPHIVAILLRGLEMIDQLGGQWMIMTATLPQIFIDELKNKGLLGQQTLVNTILIPDDREPHPEMPRRHRIKLLASKEESIESIALLVKTAKVLIVVNTVKEALAMYDRLLPYINKEQMHLLHSQFTKRDRLPKEQAITDFAQLDNYTPGIWVTTQIVEASLDVDFDYLFTEAATPDALFQRFGRCNRKGKRFNGHTPSEPNVFIFTDLEEVSGMGSIYEQVIVEKGLQALADFDEQLLGEQEKIEIVKRVFSRKQLEGTDYLKKFDKANQELKEMRAFELDKKEAQKVLRDIQSCNLVPGQANYEAVQRLIDEYESIPQTIEATEKSKRRRQLRMAIEQYTVSVNKYRLKNNKEEGRYSYQPFTSVDFRHIYYSTDMAYTKERGVELKLDENFNPFF